MRASNAGLGPGSLLGTEWGMRFLMSEVPLYSLGRGKRVVRKVPLFMLSKIVVIMGGVREGEKKGEGSGGRRYLLHAKQEMVQRDLASETERERQREKETCVDTNTVAMYAYALPQRLCLSRT